MKIQAIDPYLSPRKHLAMHSHSRAFVGALLGFLLFGAAVEPLHAASLHEGFGPLTLVEGAKPVPGGCGRPLVACTCCGRAADSSMNMQMDMAMDTGAAVVNSTVRLDAVGLNASPNLLTVTNVGASAYSINSVSNPILTFVRGETYTFNLTANGHPFYIKTVQGAGTGNAYTNGVVGNGTQTGTVTFTVPIDAPSTLFYDCANHSAMTNRIDVVPEPSTFAAVAALSLVAVLTMRRVARKAI